MTENYKSRIIDFIEGRTEPEAFFSWFESDPQILDWLQSMIPEGKNMRDLVKLKTEDYLKDLPERKKEEINSAYQSLCTSCNTEQAKHLIDLLCGLDAKTVPFSDHMNLLLYSFKTVLDNPTGYKPSYVEYMCASVKEFFEKEHEDVRDVPYDVRTLYANGKTRTKIWSYVNRQSYLYRLMTELYPNETIQKDEALYEKASFLSDVCPEYIEGHEIDEAGLIETMIEQVPETLPKTKRKKQIGDLIKKEFHIQGSKYPRWVQGGEWPVSKSGKPMRFVEQKRKKGKEYAEMLYTQFFFEDVDTGEIRVIDQFT